VVTLLPHYLRSRPEGSYRLDVDHDFYQDLLNLGPTSSTSTFQAQRRYYDFPYSSLPPCGRVLIIGAGTGNDVAAALRAQCASVDAVEIDPAIAKLGRQLHPKPLRFQQGAPPYQ